MIQLICAVVNVECCPCEAIGAVSIRGMVLCEHSDMYCEAEEWITDSHANRLAANRLAADRHEAHSLNNFARTQCVYSDHSDKL